MSIPIFPDQVQTDLPAAAKPRRNRASAKAAGRAFENQLATYWAGELEDDRIERRVRHGAKDCGDIAGLRTIRGAKVVVEAKNYSSDRIQIRKWLQEAEVEAANDDAAIGVVAVKVRGVADPSQQLVCMTAETFARLLMGGPDELRGA